MTEKEAYHEIDMLTLVNSSIFNVQEVYMKCHFTNYNISTQQIFDQKLNTSKILRHNRYKKQSNKKSGVNLSDRITHQKLNYFNIYFVIALLFLFSCSFFTFVFIQVKVWTKNYDPVIDDFTAFTRGAVEFGTVAASHKVIL